MRDIGEDPAEDTPSAEDLLDKCHALFESMIQTHDLPSSEEHQRELHDTYDQINGFKLRSE